MTGDSLRNLRRRVAGYGSVGCVFLLGLGGPLAQALELGRPFSRPPAVSVPANSATLTGEDISLPVPEVLPPQKKKRFLAELYGRLKAAPDARSADAVVLAIEKVWLMSGSETIDYLMGNALEAVASQDFPLALEILDRIVTLRPDYAEGWNQRAHVYFLQEKYYLALYDLRRTLALDPKHFQAIKGLALVMQEMGDKKAALSAYRAALAIHPHMEEARQAVEELAREVEGQGI